MSTEQQWIAVDDYFSSTLVASDAVLDAALENSANAGLPSINVAPNQGKLLYLLARIRGARRILEVGTLGGYSTIWMARALPADGVLISLEANAEYADVARRNIQAAGLSDKVSVRVGNAADTLKKLIADNTEPFDMVFLDANKDGNPQYLQSSLKLSRAGTVIIGDNVVRNGRIVDLENTDSDVQGVRDFLELMAAQPHLSSTAIQTVGSKGWDGFSISVVSE